MAASRRMAPGSPPKHHHEGTSPLPINMDWRPLQEMGKLRQIAGAEIEKKKRCSGDCVDEALVSMGFRKFWAFLLPRWPTSLRRWKWCFYRLLGSRFRLNGGCRKSLITSVVFLGMLVGAYLGISFRELLEKSQCSTEGDCSEGDCFCCLPAGYCYPTMDKCKTECKKSSSSEDILLAMKSPP